tara:strand:- start:363 stop:482 length:120 start_codon:yes stop_codon:yes gene_type:complete
MTFFKITFIDEISGLKVIINIPDEKSILDAACEQNIDPP